VFAGKVLDLKDTEAVPALKDLAKKTRKEFTKCLQKVLEEQRNKQLIEPKGEGADRFKA